MTIFKLLSTLRYDKLICYFSLLSLPFELRHILATGQWHLEYNFKHWLPWYRKAPASQMHVCLVIVKISDKDHGSLVCMCKTNWRYWNMNNNFGPHVIKILQFLATACIKIFKSAEISNTENLRNLRNRVHLNPVCI